jgi:Tfp pilus assembly protein PilE
MRTPAPRVGIENRLLGSGRQGFLLMEVLVSVAILAVAMAVLLQSIQNSIWATQISRERTKAAYLAQAKMWDMEDILYWKDAAQTYDTSGYFDSPNSDYEWEVFVDSDEDISEHVVTVRVNWTHRKRTKTFELVTVVPMDRAEKYLK